MQFRVFDNVGKKYVDKYECFIRGDGKLHIHNEEEELIIEPSDPDRYTVEIGVGLCLRKKLKLKNINRIVFQTHTLRLVSHVIACLCLIAWMVMQSR